MPMKPMRIRPLGLPFALVAAKTFGAAAKVAAAAAEFLMKVRRETWFGVICLPSRGDAENEKMGYTENEKFFVESIREFKQNATIFGALPLVGSEPARRHCY
jgi:hypothetical protein